MFLRLYMKRHNILVSQENNCQRFSYHIELHITIAVRRGAPYLPYFDEFLEDWSGPDERHDALVVGHALPAFRAVPHWQCIPKAVRDRTAPPHPHLVGVVEQFLRVMWRSFLPMISDTSKRASRAKTGLIHHKWISTIFDFSKNRYFDITNIQFDFIYLSKFRPLEPHANKVADIHS